MIKKNIRAEGNGNWILRSVDDSEFKQRKLLLENKSFMAINQQNLMIPPI